MVQEKTIDSGLVGGPYNMIINLHPYLVFLAVVAIIRGIVAMGKDIHGQLKATPLLYKGIKIKLEESLK